MAQRPERPLTRAGRVPAEPAPVVSVVLACRNAEATLAAQLEALARQGFAEPWELMLVDNGSSDGTLAVADRFAERLPLRVVDASERAGQAFALNAGVRAAGAERIVFCDADDEVADGWLAALAGALAEHELVAGRHDVEALNAPAFRASREPAFVHGLPTLPFPPFVPHATSSALGLTRRLHDELGGFDETMDVLFDTDLSVRAQLAGHAIHEVPEAVVRYRYRDTLGGTFRQARSYAAAMALLQCRYVPAGARAPGRRTWLVEGWQPVLGALPRAGTAAGRARLAWLLGWQAGRYAGSVRYRVLAV